MTAENLRRGLYTNFSDTTAFTRAGFTELASEWWHFGDMETEATMRAIVGGGGLDFTA